MPTITHTLPRRILLLGAVALGVAVMLASGGSIRSTLASARPSQPALPALAAPPPVATAAAPAAADLGSGGSIPTVTTGLRTAVPYSSQPMPPVKAASSTVYPAPAPRKVAPATRRPATAVPVDADHDNSDSASPTSSD